MTVYKGILHEISEGEVISSEGTGGYYTHNVGISRLHRTGVDSHAGFTRREIVRIGDMRIRNVMLTQKYDTLLREAIGKEVAISIDDGGDPNEFKRHTVHAIRTPGAGLVRVPLGKMILGAILTTFKLWLVAIVGGFLFTVAALFVGAGIGRLLDDDTGYWAFVAGGLGALFVLYFLLKPFFDIYKAFKLRNARLTLDGELVEGYSAPQNV